MKKLTIIFTLIASILLATAFSSCKSERKYTTTEFDDYILFQNLKYGDDERNILDLFVPKNLSGDACLVMQIHGGGWVAGDKDGLSGDYKQWINKKIIYATINYRYADGFSVTASDILSDISSSLVAIKTKCESLGINAKKVGFYGGSAGGHLSLLYAYKMANNSPIKPAFVASYSGPTDLTDSNYLEEKDNKDQVVDLLAKISGAYQYENGIKDYSFLLKDVSPVFYANELSVPTLIFHGTNDDIVPYSNAVTLDSILTEYGVAHEFITFKNSGHGLENDSESSKKANELLMEYAERYL